MEKFGAVATALSVGRACLQRCPMDADPLGPGTKMQLQSFIWVGTMTQPELGRDCPGLVEFLLMCAVGRRWIPWG